MDLCSIRSRNFLVLAEANQGVLIIRTQICILNFVTPSLAIAFSLRLEITGLLALFWTRLLHLGTVYQATDKVRNMEVAIKVEKNSGGVSLIHYAFYLIESLISSYRKAGKQYCDLNTRSSPHSDVSIIIDSCLFRFSLLDILILTKYHS